MLSRINIVLAVLLVLTTALVLVSGVDYTRPNIEILPDMKYSPAYDAYSRNPNFPNGRTLQEPVPGTIARGQTPLHYQATPEDALRAGEELQNPTLQLDAKQQLASAGRGGAIFGVLCVACHGSTGVGDGLVPKYGFPPPPSLLTGKSVSMKDGQLLHILTYGQANMPNFAAQLSPARRWDVINHIRLLQKRAAAQQKAKTEQPPEESEQDAAAAPQEQKSDTESPSPSQSNEL